MKDKGSKNLKPTGLTKENKEILRSLMGKASSAQIDFNKVRDEWKYATDWF